MASATHESLDMAPVPTTGRLYQNILSTDNSYMHLGDVYNNHRSPDERALKVILDSLSYPGMTDRRDALAEAHKKTFDWTFLDGETEFLMERDPRGNEERDRYVTVDMSFRSWLQQKDQGLFCVTGKPGSGKSTFMKTLAANSEATRILQTWADDAILLRSDHFFWILGAPMQKSVEGLLRGILHSVLLGLSQCADSESWGVIKHVCGSRWQSATNNGAWSRSELKQMLTRLDSVPKVKSFFLIDALDECEPQDRLNDLANEILWTSRLPNVKLCVSCRPWDVFTRKFESSISLRLDHLTRRDMETYIEARLTSTEEEKGWEFEFRDRTSTAKQLIQSVARSAEGVFLWTELVVTAMCSEIRKGSKVERLTQIISDFPVDLDKYFHQLIFDRIGRSRRNVQDTAAALKLALVIHASIESDTAFPESHPFADSYMNFWLLRGGYLKPDFSWMDNEHISHPPIPRMLDQTASYLQETCNDLLVVNHATKKVGFIHRTVFDFLSDNKVHDTLEQNANSHFSNQGFVFDLARLRCICLLRTENDSCESLILLLGEVLKKYQHSTQMDENVDWLSTVESVAVLQMRVNHHCSYWVPVPMSKLDLLMPRRCMKAGLSRFLLELYSHVPALALDERVGGIDVLGEFLNVTNQPEIRNPDLSLLQNILEIGCDPNTTMEFDFANYEDPSYMYICATYPELHSQNCVPTAWTAWLRVTFMQLVKTESTSEEPKEMLEWRKRQAAAIMVLLLQYGANPHCMVCVRRHPYRHNEACRLVALDRLIESIVPAESVIMLRNLRELCSDKATGCVLRRNQRRRAVRSIQTFERFYERSAKDADTPEHHSPHRKLVMAASLDCCYLVSNLVSNMANLRYALCNRCLSRKCVLLVATWCLDCGGQSILCSTCLHGNPSESPELGYPCGGCKGDHGPAIGNHICVTAFRETLYRPEGSDQALEDLGVSIRLRYPTDQAISTMREWYAKDPIQPDLSFDDVVRNTRLSSPQPPHRTQESGTIFGEVAEERGGRSNRPWLL